MKTNRREVMADYVNSLGGIIGAKFVRTTGEDGDAFTIEDRNGKAVHIAEDKTEHTSLSALLAYLDREYPLPLQASGSNTEGGNAANNRIGNYDIYGHTILDNGVTYGEVLGKDSDYVRTTSRKIRPLGRKVLRVAKLLDCPTDSHWAKVWDNYPRLLVDLASYYGLDTVLRDRKTLTIEEFGLRYNLPLPPRV